MIRCNELWVAAKSVISGKWDHKTLVVIKLIWFIRVNHSSLKVRSLEKLTFTTLKEKQINYRIISNKSFKRK